MDYVKIPQNVKVKDTVIGPFSLIQIGAIGAGGGLSYVLLSGVKKALGSVPILANLVIWIPLAIAVLFVMVKVNGLSISILILLMFESYAKPRVRVWAPRSGIDMTASMLTTKKKKKKKELTDTKDAPKTNMSITDLVGVLDSSGEQPGGSHHETISLSQHV